MYHLIYRLGRSSILQPDTPPKADQFQENLQFMLTILKVRNQQLICALPLRGVYPLHQEECS
jgi:hypothetical protein